MKEVNYTIMAELWAKAAGGKKLISFATISLPPEEGGGIVPFDLEPAKELAEAISKENGVVCHVVNAKTNKVLKTFGKRKTLAKNKTSKPKKKEYFIQFFDGEPGKEKWKFIEDFELCAHGDWQDIRMEFGGLEKAIEYAKSMNKEKKLPCRVVDDTGEIKHSIGKFYF